MKPAPHDFDVITDSPAIKSRPPQQAQGAPQPDAQDERRSAPQPKREQQAAP